MNAETIRRYATIFRGRTDCWGALHGECIREKLTLDHYRNQLAGKNSLGIYPLRTDDTCYWASTDFDDGNVEAARQLMDALYDLGINTGVWLEKSKSKGWHVWLFLDAPAQAKDVRLLLRAALKKATLPPTVEVFPKQDSLGETPDRIGSYIHLPYYGNGNDGRRQFCDVQTLNPIPLETFIAEHTAFPTDLLPLVLDRLPPELRVLSEGKAPAPEVAEVIPDGQRNATLTSLAGSMRRRGMSQLAIAAALLGENALKCQPPLPDADVERIARSVSRYAPAECPYHPQAEITDRADRLPRTDAGNAEPVAVMVSLADVQPERVHWLWSSRIPLGKLTILAGPPGVGKSYALLDIAARVSQGAPLPDGGMALLGDVVLLTAEDGLGDTVRSRLDLLGADSGRIHALTMVRQGENERMFSLEEHLPLLERAIAERQAVLAIIDPLLAYTGRADSYKEAEVRGLLAPVAVMAERTGCALVAIVHLNKRGGEHSPLNRITASVAFVAQARSVLLLAIDPQDENGQRRILAPVKMNLCAHPPSLALHFGDDGGLFWDGPVATNAADLLAVPMDDGERGSLAEAQEFLRDLLRGGPVEAEEVLKRARRAGVAEKTLRRAKAALRVISERQGGLADEGYWAWVLPKMAIATNIGNVASLDGSDTKTRPPEGQVGHLREAAPTCPHRPPGEVEDRWAHGDAGPDAHACGCCGAPVRPELWQDGLCAVCRNGQPVSGHLVRLAFDLGAKVVRQ